MEEIWKPYVFNNECTMYLVSNYGRIISFWKGVPMILSPLNMPNKHKPDKIYKRYILCINGGQYKKLAHRLVAETFLSNPNNYPQVNHIDGDPSNNCVLNLEWCTQEMNQQHAIKTGLHIEKKGSENAHAKKIGRFLNGELIKTYGFVNQVLEDGFNPTHAVRATRSGKYHKGYNWNYI